MEKPLTYLSEDGQKLIDTAKKNNIILTCGYIERFNPAVATVKDFLKIKHCPKPFPQNQYSKYH